MLYGVVDGKAGYFPAKCVTDLEVSLDMCEPSHLVFVQSSSGLHLVFIWSSSSLYLVFGLSGGTVGIAHLLPLSELFLGGNSPGANSVERAPSTLSNVPQGPYVIITVYQHYWYTTKRSTVASEEPDGNLNLRTKINAQQSTRNEVMIYKRNKFMALLRVLCQALVFVKRSTSAETSVFCDFCFHYSKCS